MTTLSSPASPQAHGADRGGCATAPQATERFVYDVLRACHIVPEQF